MGLLRGPDLHPELEQGAEELDAPLDLDGRSFGLLGEVARFGERVVDGLGLGLGFPEGKWAGRWWFGVLLLLRRLWGEVVVAAVGGAEAVAAVSGVGGAHASAVGAGVAAAAGVDVGQAVVLTVWCRGGSGGDRVVLVLVWPEMLIEALRWGSIRRWGRLVLNGDRRSRVLHRCRCRAAVSQVVLRCCWRSGILRGRAIWQEPAVVVFLDGTEVIAPGKSP